MTLYFEERTLDISKGDKSELDGIVDPITLRRQEGGSDSIGIIGVIYDGDKIFDASGSSVTFKMLNPHGQYVDVPGTVENGTSGIVSVVVNSEMTAVAGPVQIAYFQLNKNGNIVTTNNIPLVVLADNDLTTERADGYRTEVEKLVEYLVQLKANFKDVASISVAYQAGESPTAVPTGSWSTSMVTVGQGWYLWTRIIVNYSNGTSQTFYMKSYQGKDNANYGAATTSKDGLMSAADKKNLDDLKSAWDSAGFISHGKVEPGSDLDKVTGPGPYYLESSDGYINSPDNTKYGTLLVFRPAINSISTMVQVVVVNGSKSFYIRNTWGSTFYPWIKYSGQ